MNIQEITQNMSQIIANMTQEEKFDLFLKANIIHEDGYYDSRFFSDSTVKADREAKTPFRKHTNQSLYSDISF